MLYNVFFALFGFNNHPNLVFGTYEPLTFRVALRKKLKGSLKKKILRVLSSPNALTCWLAFCARGCFFSAFRPFHFGTKNQN